MYSHPDLQKVLGWWGGGGVVGWWVAHKILVSAPVPLELILTGLGLGLEGLGLGTGLDNIQRLIK